MNPPAQKPTLAAATTASTANAAAASQAKSALKLLMVAFHFPPIAGSSGYLRTLKFAKYLPGFGVAPTILTVVPSVYPSYDKNAKPPLPETTAVARSFALDARRAFSIKGKSLSLFSLPDRYSSWIPFGVLKGLRLLKAGDLDAIFSTYPIASAHVIGLILHKLTGKPWVADFRDPMWDDFTTAASLPLRIRMAIEKAVMRRCAFAMVCTDAMFELFKKRYPDHKDKLLMIPNGFDDEDFRALDASASGPREGGPVRLVHTGLLEPVDRDPVPFFHAVKALCAKHPAAAPPLTVDLIAPSDEAYYNKVIGEMGLMDIIRIGAWRPYAKSLEAMSHSDILLLFQGPSCFSQVPAKLYEYIRVGRPILAITPAAGETGKLVARTGAGSVVPHDDPEAILKVLEAWVEAVPKGGALPVAGPEAQIRFSRRSHAQALAERLRANLNLHSNGDSP